MEKIRFALLILVLVTPTDGLAQTWSTDDQLTGAIRLPTFPTIIRRKSVTARLPTVHQQPPGERSWPGRHPVLCGGLVGLGVGIAVELAVIPGASGGEPHSAYLPMFASVGTGAGSLMGLIVSTMRR